MEKTSVNSKEIHIQKLRTPTQMCESLKNRIFLLRKSFFLVLQREIKSFLLFSVWKNLTASMASMIHIVISLFSTSLFYRSGLSPLVLGRLTLSRTAIFRSIIISTFMSQFLISRLKKHRVWFGFNYYVFCLLFQSRQIVYNGFLLQFL